MDLAEQGRQDALARKEASSLEPEYQLGYADGVHERAHVAAASFRDVTIDGDALTVERQPGSLAFHASIETGDVYQHLGIWPSMEDGVAACLSAIKAEGRSTVRLAAIEARLAFSHPEITHTDRQRLASLTVEYIREHRKTP